VKKKMKTTPLNPKRTGTAMPIQRIAPPAVQEKPPVESLNLSPERITDGASTTTHLLTEILERDEKTYHWRHWGINE